METFLHALSFAALVGTVNISLNFLGAIESLFSKPFDRPLDFGLHLGRERLLGRSTTLIGIVVALATGVAVSSPHVFFGTVIGLGTYAGHALGSFIKRRFSVPDGAYMPVVDHGDYVIVTGAIGYTLGWINLPVYLTAITLTLAIHPFFCILGFRMGIRKYPY